MYKTLRLCPCYTCRFRVHICLFSSFREKKFISFKMNCHKMWPFHRAWRNLAHWANFNSLFMYPVVHGKKLFPKTPSYILVSTSHCKSWNFNNIRVFGQNQNKVDKLLNKIKFNFVFVCTVTNNNKAKDLSEGVKNKINFLFNTRICRTPTFLELLLLTICWFYFFTLKQERLGLL